MYQYATITLRTDTYGYGPEFRVHGGMLDASAISSALTNAGPLDALKIRENREKGAVNGQDASYRGKYIITGNRLRSGQSYSFPVRT